MSILTPLLPSRRRTGEPPVARRQAGQQEPFVPAHPQEWHVGLSRQGMFPHHEASCPCAKAACGLAIPRADVLCPVHQGARTFLQLHTTGECEFPRRTWLPRKLSRLGRSAHQRHG